MATVNEQYDAYLDDLHEESRGTLFANYLGSYILREIDPIAYNVGLADFEPTCEVCGEQFWAEDDDAEAVCEDCLLAQDEEDDED